VVGVLVLDYLQVARCDLDLAQSRPRLRTANLSSLPPSKARQHDRGNARPRCLTNKEPESETVYGVSHGISTLLIKRAKRTCAQLGGWNRQRPPTSRALFEVDSRASPAGGYEARHPRVAYSPIAFAESGLRKYAVQQHRICLTTNGLWGGKLTRKA